MKSTFSHILILLLLLSGCAKVVTPVGGPRDTEPPKVTKEQPANQSVDFHSPKITITMDEFFTLNNPTENVMVSPPFKHQPEYKIKGKSLIIKIKDTLRANTTYNMVFSDCIKDYNEGNPLKLYQYSFSTGSFIDSCMLKGKITNAKTLQKSEDFHVMLYREDIDSLPLTTIPDYITKTTSDGSFTFKNIASGDYKIFALKDINGNFIYDLPNESIAFSDQLVHAYPAPRTDSIGIALHLDSVPEPIQLTSFEVSDSLPKLMHYENPEAGFYQFPFSKAVNLLDINILTDDSNHLQNIDYFDRWNAGYDTLSWYLKSLAFDSIKFVCTADGQVDTVLLKPFKAKGGGGGRGGSAKKATARLRTSFINEGDHYKPLTLHFSYPIRPTDTIHAVLMSKTDTLLVPIVVPDTFVTDLAIPLKLEVKKSYQLIIPDSSFYGYNGLTHDTLRSSFTYKSEKEYGNIILNYELDSLGYQIIAQLWSGKNLIQKDLLYESTTITYAHLEPGAYQVKIIHDINNNGVWDSGDYRQKKQPERIATFDKTITLRAFWDVEETFKIDRNK